MERRGGKKSVIDAHTESAVKGVETSELRPNANVNELKLMHRFFYFARLK